MAEEKHADDPYLGNPMRGVSVYHLRGELMASLEVNRETLFRKMESRCMAKLDLTEANVADIEEDIIRGKGKDLTCPRDGQKGAAYVDSIFGPDNAGLAKFMLSYTWRYKIKDIVGTLDAYCNSKRPPLDPKKTYIWICCLCINQWRVQEEKANGKKVSFEVFQQTFGHRVESIGHVLAMMSPWKDPQYTSRVWCNFELFTAVEKKTDLEILMPPREAKSLHQALLDGSGIQEVWRALMRIDISKADASVPEDKMNIFELVREGCGFETLNLEVSKRLRIWIVERCLNDVEQGMEEGQLSGEKAVKMCSEVGSFLTDLGQYRDAARLMERGLAECKHPSVAESLCHAELLQSRGDLHSKEKEYPAAISSFAQARALREKLEQLASEEGAELIRCIGLTHKHSGEPDVAWKCYEEAYELRKQTSTLDTEGAADLLRSMGALTIDHRKDPDAALELYLKAMEVRRSNGSLDTPGGSYLMMCVGIVKAECLDSDNALQIYDAAERIRERTGTLDAKTGKYLRRKIKEAKLDLHVQDLVHAFSLHDSSKRNGCFPVRVIEQLLKAEPKEVEKMLAKFPGLQGSTTAEFSFKQLLAWLYPDSLVAQALVGGSTGCVPVVGHSLGAGIPASVAAEARVSLLVWNIQSPEYCPNALEFLPGNSALSREARLSLRELKKLARQYMLHPTETKKLEELLPDNRPLTDRYLTSLEKAPLTDAKTLSGLTEWLRDRRKTWQDLWPGTDAEALTKEWAAKPEVRWKYWKRQTLSDWLCDDSSGGKLNPLLLPAKPSIDDLCWNLGLSSADRKFPRHPARSRRACWIQLDAEDENAELPQTGKFDFFKLLVWDLILAAIMEEAIPTKSETDALLNELKRMDSRTRLNKIVERISAVDVAVCLEVPSMGLPNLDDFWVVDSSSVATSFSGTMSQELHTAIIARKSVFLEPLAQGFHLDSGAANPRVVACTLRRRADGAEFHIVAVHLSGKGEDFDDVMPKVEQSIRPNTVLAGDFNVDLRKKRPHWLSEDGTRRLETLVRQAKAIELQYGTSNKQRSPFQAQVSKMFFQDFSMKDFAFLGEAYYPAELRGLIARSHCLPDAEIPSDHAPLTLDLVLQMSGSPP